MFSSVKCTEVMQRQEGLNDECEKWVLTRQKYNIQIDCRQTIPTTDSLHHFMFRFLCLKGSTIQHEYYSYFILAHAVLLDR